MLDFSISPSGGPRPLNGAIKGLRQVFPPPSNLHNPSQERCLSLMLSLSSWQSLLARMQSHSTCKSLQHLSEQRGQGLAQAPITLSVQHAFPQPHSILPMSRDHLAWNDLPAFPNAFHPKGMAGAPPPPGSFCHLRSLFLCIHSNQIPWPQDRASTVIYLFKIISCFPNCTVNLGG